MEQKHRQKSIFCKNKGNFPFEKVAFINMNKTIV